MYGGLYRQAMAVVAARTVPEPRELRGGLRNDCVSSLADLAAVHLYLTEEWPWLDAALLEGTVGAHLPLARCVASGLRRLPSYRGPAIVRTSAVSMVMDWYRENQFVVDQGFWTASVPATELRENGPGLLVWSLTGRRTGAVDPDAPERLVFSPGTRFKVLRVSEGLRPVVLMRELFPPELAVHRDQTGWLDESTVAELEGAAAEPSLQMADITGPRGRLPGLIFTAKAECEPVDKHVHAADTSKWFAAARRDRPGAGYGSEGSPVR